MSKKIIVFYPAVNSTLEWLKSNFNGQFGGRLTITTDVKKITEISDTENLLIIDASDIVSNGKHHGAEIISKKAAKKIAQAKNLETIKSEENILTEINNHSENFLNKI